MKGKKEERRALESWEARALHRPTGASLLLPSKKLAREGATNAGTQDYFVERDAKGGKVGGWGLCFECVWNGGG